MGDFVDNAWMARWLDVWLPTIMSADVVSSIPGIVIFKDKRKGAF
jgi:hypothetical protein